MRKIIALFAFSACATLAKAQLTLQLSGTNITCYNARNGSVNLTVSGGTSPYTFQWSNAATTEDISSLQPNYYAVTVTDAASNTATDGVTLTQPSEITFQFTLSDYIVNGTHFNLSSYSWQNGSVTTSVSGGVSPYSYHWTNGITTANPSSLDAGSYKLTVTDNSGCTKVSESQILSKPDRSDWTMSGNSGSNPSANFIGTIDSVDFVLRTKNLERFRIKANGDLKIPGLAPSTGITQVGVDSTGKLITSALLTPWLVSGNTGINDQNNFIGTLNAADLVFKTTATTSPPGLQEHMRITKGGQVLIGAPSGDQKLTVAHNETNGGIAINRLSPNSGKNEIRFEQNDIAKWAIGNDINGTGQQTFFIWDHVYNGSRFFINQYGKVGIGVNPPATNTTPYLLYVEGGVMTRDVKVTSNTFADYVFDKDYKLMSIYELEQFIKQNNHLPEIPSAKEIEKNEGFEVGDMQVKLLKKIEEQSLYIIDLQKQVDELRKEVKQVKK